MGKIKNAGLRTVGALASGTAKTIEGIQYVGNKTKAGAKVVVHSPKVAAVAVATKVEDHRAINAARDQFKAELVATGREILASQRAVEAG